MRRRTRAGLLLAGLLAGISGCGLGPGRTPGGVGLAVTDDFGRATVFDSGAPRVSGQDTVMRLLERNVTITTRYGGGFVQSIDGRSGGHVAERPIDWFYYVNGSEAEKGAAATVVHPGDRVWWDRHDWGAAMDTPAVVGSFPEPFLHGRAGRRLPVRVDCLGADPGPCRMVAERLGAAGVPTVGRGSPGPAAGGASALRVLVGVWRALRRDPTAARLEGGPVSSGVYARPTASGASIELLDERGRRAQALGPAGGLVAATRSEGDMPVWVVTGTDSAGVRQAAGALRPEVLRHRFAVAVGPGASVALPEAPR
ncbi:MAG: DUF4430 domain-containing protein [Actinobacteria bacterium]|nr:MAG: DUF4430 domain-containing protein [Actinomycetota bacterium]